MALVLANAAFQAAEFVGWPEARIPLAEATIYIATAPKSNSTVMAIGAAMKDVESGRTLAVPEHLRDAHYKGAKKLGHGVGYKYAHEGKDHFVARIIWARTKPITSRPNRVWRRKSRNASRNGARSFQKCGLKKRRENSRD